MLKISLVNFHVSKQQWPFQRSWIFNTTHGFRCKLGFLTRLSGSYNKFGFWTGYSGFNRSGDKYNTSVWNFI